MDTLPVHFILMNASPGPLSSSLRCFWSTSNDLPDFIISQLGIYANGISLYYYLSRKSNRSGKVKLATTLGKNLHWVANLSNKWSVNLNAWKAKLVSFNHHSDSFLSAISKPEAKFRATFYTLGSHFYWHVVE